MCVRRQVFATLLLAAMTSSTAADELVSVTFKLHSPTLPEKTKVFITGNVSALGRWNPGKVAMKAAGRHTWQHTIRVKPGSKLEYKYTLGTWRREGANREGNPLKNLKLSVKRDVIHNDRIDVWTNKKKRTTRGQITGTVRYHRDLRGKGILPRDVIVWLPPVYDATDARFGVLYLHDGQNIVDPRTSAFGVDWGVDETCTKLFAEKSVAPFLVVGIYNTKERTLEYLPGDKGTAYRDFVVRVVKPLIDRTYRTKPSRTHTWVGGSSAGGLCAFALAWQCSDTFSAALCFSPSFRFQQKNGPVKFDYVSEVARSKRPEHGVRFYVDNGGVGLERLLQPGIDAMLKELDRKKFSRGRDYLWVKAPKAEHNESAWAKRFPDAIKFVAQNADAE